MSDDAEPQDGQPSEEELAAMMYQRLAEVPVPAVLVQSLASFCDMAAIRMGLGPEGQERVDLQQARLSIDCVRALLPVCESALGPQQAEPFKGALASLQMAFAQAVGGQEGASGAETGDAPAAPPPPPPSAPPADSGLWVPPHHRG